MTTDPDAGSAHPDAARPRRLGTPWLGSAVVAAMVLTGVVTWLIVGVAHVGRAQARAGARYPTSQSLDVRRNATVSLPWGTLTVGAGAPRTRLPQQVASVDVGSSPLPPDGGRFVGVRWKRGDDNARNVQVGTVNTHLSVVTHGHTYPLESSGVARQFCTAGCFGQYSDNTVWVAVPGDAADLRIAVEFDGVTQTVDAHTGAVDRGRAAAAYQPVRTGGGACSAPSWSGGFTAERVEPTTCSAMAQTAAWVPGLGWTRAGTVWTLVTVTLDGPTTARLSRSNHDWRVVDTLSTFSYTVDGAAPAERDVPVATAASSLGPGYAYHAGNALLAFAVPAQTGAASTAARHLTILAHVALTPGSADSRLGPTRATVTWSADL